jgi:putative addiction module killer protein
MEFQLKILATPAGDSPFEDWYLSIRDKLTRSRIRARLDRLVLGNFGDSKAIADGVFELRFHFGAGYRVYFSTVGDLVVLLMGGDKASQAKDIQSAISLWKLYQDDPKRFQRDF